MDTAAQERFSRVLSLAAEDELHRQLRLHCELLDEPLLAILEKLSETERTVIREYIRLMGASALRLTELACELYSD